MGEYDKYYNESKYDKIQILNKIELFKNQSKDNFETFEKLIEFLKPHFIDKESDFKLIDFNFGCITSTISFDVSENKIELSKWCEVWNDKECSLIDSSYAW